MLAAVGIAVTMLLAAGAAFSAEFPRRPVRIVVPFVPSGGADIVARTLGNALSETWSVPIVIDNRPGAGGNLGTHLVAAAPPDGYTLLMGNVGPMAINPTLQRPLPYDPTKDFSPVSFLVDYPNVLVVGMAGPKTVAELIERARSSPGKLTFASAGIGSSTHLAAELLKIRANVDVRHIPYKGGAQALIDVISGQVTMYFSSVIGALPHVKNERLRALAVTSRARSQVAQEIPTIAEIGYPGFEAVNWQALFAPARTPRNLVALLNREVAATMRVPAVERSLLSQGAEPAAGTPEALARYLNSEIEKWERVIRTAGVRADA